MPHFNFTTLQAKLDARQAKIAVVGLGYVGLPLAIEFAKKYSVVGLDIKEDRIMELREGADSTQEVTTAQLAAASDLELTSNPEDIAQASVYIVTVPTPIDHAKRPDLRPLLAASKSVGAVLEAGDVVVYESTVYPGCTEEDCVPILEKESGLTFATDKSARTGDVVTTENGAANVDANDARFFVGYSPERINPGDKAHGVADIVKVTSGSTPGAADFIDALYASIITAGTHKAPSIRVAEAAKVIENTQRDVNIALINELAMLFNRLGIDTHDILEAAATKWNFLPFKPGLVGGHCIGVDPYYLTHKAQMVNFHPQMILAGRRTNDGMGTFVAGEFVKLMAKKNCYYPGAKVLVLGLTFKENCPDLRNTRVIDVVEELVRFNLDVDVHDPWANAADSEAEFGIKLILEPEKNAYEAAIICVAHREYERLRAYGIKKWLKQEHVIYDLKRVLPPSDSVVRF
jgi:UDP-N-acetyl-D-galactosamine dehydrogenase